MRRTSREPLGASGPLPPRQHAAPRRRHTRAGHRERSTWRCPPPSTTDLSRLLDACFQPDEFVAIAPAAESDEGEIVPRRGVTLTAAEWKAKVAAKGGIDRVFGTKLGLFLRINPMKKGGAKNEDVTAFRHVLVEFDRDDAGKPIPKDEQYHAIVASGMPVAALIDSGNKSLHAWIRVDAPDETEYRRRVDIIWDWFSGINLDRQNRNPSRLSRCPDGWRTVDGEVRASALLASDSARNRGRHGRRPRGFRPAAHPPRPCVHGRAGTGAAAACRGRPAPGSQDGARRPVEGAQELDVHRPDALGFHRRRRGGDFRHGAAARST